MKKGRQWIYHCLPYSSVVQTEGMLKRKSRTNNDVVVHALDVFYATGNVFSLIFFSG